MDAKYRIGRRSKRAILEIETGHEFLVFPQGKEKEAKEYCEYLNNASPLKERIKELEEQIETLHKEHLEVYRHRDSLQSQLKEADSKAVRFAAWLSINNYKSSNGVMYALYEGDTLIHVKPIAELFEIFENQSK